MSNRVNDIWVDFERYIEENPDKRKELYLSYFKKKSNKK